MASLFKKMETFTDPKTGKTVKRKSKKWWGRYRDELRIVRRVPLATDKTAAQAMLNDRICKVERIKAGLIDPGDEQRKRPMREHLADFKRYLTNKGITIKQVTESTKRIQKIVDSRKLKLLSDLSADAVVEFLSELREKGKSANAQQLPCIGQTIQPLASPRSADWLRSARPYLGAECTNRPSATIGEHYPTMSSTASSRQLVLARQSKPLPGRTGRCCTSWPRGPAFGRESLAA